ncbi:MAG: T9SS type A sorting domain-containing protein, partial [Candidatus Cloacimonadaceae bacterium]|nr:T9SS type A sorting domain-containing protein [Candidatus Cloacimonadaceae bacterium]
HGYTNYTWEEAVAVDDPYVPALPRITLSAYPNPFNPETTIRFTLQMPAEANLTIYNSRGQRVLQLLNSQVEAGEHNIVWQADDALASGLYFAVLQAGSYRQSVKLMLIK